MPALVKLVMVDGHTRVGQVAVVKRSGAQAVLAALVQASHSQPLKALVSKKLLPALRHWQEAPVALSPPLR